MSRNDNVFISSQVSIANLPYSSDAWILANVGQTGFYRVNYDQGNWEALAQQLRVDHVVGGAVWGDGCRKRERKI